MAKEKKKIDKKNYIILAVIVIIVVILVFYARSWYLMASNYTKDSTMLSVINEIKLEEISNYTLENQNFILYSSSSQNEDIKSFENSFKKFVIKNDLEEDMLYINIDDLDINELKSELQSYATDEVKNSINPNSNVSLYIFENQNITNVINNANNLDNDQIKDLLIEYGMIEND